MASLTTYRGTVYPWHCDHMGHMNVMWYAGKFDEATWQLAAALGLTGAFLRESGAGMVAAEQHTRYLAELHAGDALRIDSTVLEVGARKLRFVHEMRREPDGMTAAVSTLVGVHIDRATRRARELPGSARTAALALLATPAGASGE